MSKRSQYSLWCIITILISITAYSWMGRLASSADKSFLGQLSKDLTAGPEPVFLVLLIFLVAWFFSSLFKISNVNHTLNIVSQHKEEGVSGEETDDLENALFDELVDQRSGKFKTSALYIDRQKALSFTTNLVNVGLQKLPKIFLALGILFTFIGLLIGLGGLQFQEGSNSLTNQLQNSLLPAVALAFRSSVIGIFASLTATGFAGKYQSELDTKCRKIRTASRQARLNGHPEQAVIDTKNSTRNLLETAKSQNEKMSELLTEIAHNLSGKIAEKMGDELQSTVGAPVSELNEQMAELTESRMEHHSDALDSVLDDFLEGFNESLGTQFQQLEDVLKETITWHESTQESMDRLVEKVTEHQQKREEQLKREKELLEARISTLEKQTNHARELVQHLSDTLENFQNLSKKLENSQAQVEDLYSEIAGEADTITNGIDNLETSQKKLKSQMQEFQENLRSITESSSEVTKRMNETLEDVPERIEDTVQQLNREVDQGLKNSFENFDTNTAEIVEHLDGTHYKIQDELEKLNQTFNRVESLVEELDIKSEVESSHPEVRN